MSVLTYAKIVGKCLLFTIVITIVYYSYKIHFIEINGITRIYFRPNEYYDYLVRGEKCLIPNLPAFNEDVAEYYTTYRYLNCSKYELLTYIIKTNDGIQLMIRKSALKSYTANSIRCCYSYVYRNGNSTDPDNDLNYTKCEYFNNYAFLNRTTILVTCTDNITNEIIYKNTHAFTILKDVQQKINDSSTHSNEDSMKILFIGIDNMSRLNLQRTMPLTYKYLRDNDWIEYLGYNKVGDNTFPNLMAVFAGINSTFAYKNCSNNIDNCKLLWYDFNDLGFITAYAEDTPTIATFNYHKKGFIKSPTDFYFRPYMLASEQISKVTKFSVSYCTGPETSAERIIHIIKDFSETFQNYSTFGVFWMNSFSHNDINNPSMMDETFLNFFQDIKNDDTFEKHVIIFISDHGMRVGKYRSTKSGWYEERLPFLEFWIPDYFRKKYANYYENLKSNHDKLTTPYDLFMTLQDLLKIKNVNYSIRNSSGCTNCHSLFRPIPTSRICKDVSIDDHYCTCIKYVQLDKNNKLSNQSINFVLKELEQIISKSTYQKQCAKYKLDNVVRLRIANSDKQFVSYVLIEFQTYPEAIFEATLILSKRTKNYLHFKLSGDISRLDIYANSSGCVNDSVLKKYCYCL